ncbi:hypothetical protein SAMN04488581_0280 [Mycolicibacterium neoaurum]|uniref:Transmembrane protein n=1 Tax=Mycolicibacterium neoaurum TaxID=1795 RepID=A0AAV2WE68_MYCNE|nr:hypothetical protein C1S81_24570 [Mycolicibacterium neoaurum]CDQ42554.1 hypothetical protein BN1047_00407 [Mycolicibacterium neoaurum]SDC20066.1 hypothetical protein SAMN04488581_0280 [Mycolicibacterium neoaurum]
MAGTIRFAGERGDTVVETAVVAYLIGWVVSTAIIFMASRRLNDPANPVPHGLLLSAVAGTMWPLLLLGAAEFSSVAVASSAASHLKTETQELVGAGVVPLR